MSSFEVHNGILFLTIPDWNVDLPASIDKMSALVLEASLAAADVWLRTYGVPSNTVKVLFLSVDRAAGVTFLCRSLLGCRFAEQQNVNLGHPETKYSIFPAHESQLLVVVDVQNALPPMVGCHPLQTAVASLDYVEKTIPFFVVSHRRQSHVLQSSDIASIAAVLQCICEEGCPFDVIGVIVTCVDWEELNGDPSLFRIACANAVEARLQQFAVHVELHFVSEVPRSCSVSSMEMLDLRGRLMRFILGCVEKMGDEELDASDGRDSEVDDEEHSALLADFEAKRIEIFNRDTRVLQDATVAQHFQERRVEEAQKIGMKLAMAASRKR